MLIHSSQKGLRRAGFTLVEVLVAAGLCMLIMSVLATAFAAGIDTFSLLKSTGEMAERLATAQTILTNDLRGVHLEAESGEPVKVSQLRLDQLGSGDPFARPQPKGFFRLVQATRPATDTEGTDRDGVPSTKSTSHRMQMAIRLPANQASQVFTTRITNAPWVSTSIHRDSNGNTAPATLTATTLYPDISAGNPTPFGTRLQSESLGLFSGLTGAAGSDARFASRWAEVSYFLSPTQTGTTAGGIPVFSLHRRVRLLATNEYADTQLNWSQLQATLPGISCSPTVGVPQGTKPVNGPGDITSPANRLGSFQATNATGVDNLAPLGTGEDILLMNVVSFEIMAAWDGLGGVVVGNQYPFGVDLPDIPSQAPSATFPTGTGNNRYRRVATVNGVDAGNSTKLRVFDTWSTSLSGWNNPTILRAKAMATDPDVFDPNPNYVPLTIRLKAVQIKLRIYDPKNKLTRQVTIIQDL